MRRTQIWIVFIALAATGLVALRAPAGSPPPNLDRAIASQRAIAVERPDDPEVFNDLGNLLVLAGERGAAEEAYRQAIELAPDRVGAHYNLALLLAQTDRPRAALEQLRWVVEADPDHAWAHYQIGALLDARGADRRAVKHYALAFRLDPQLAFAEVNPHVIDNRHLTRAMLLAYRDPSIAAQAPKTYEQPGRIVDLLVTAPAEAAVDGAPEAAPKGRRSRATFAPGAEAADGAEGAETPEGDRVLREGDLERGGSVNQLVVPGYQPPRGGTRVPPAPTYTPPGRRSGSDGRAPGASPRPPERPRFVPGVPSTGRLDLELVPDERAHDDRAVAAG